MLPGTLHGTGATTLLTGTRGAHFSGITIMDINTAGTLNITAITTTANTTATLGIMTFITVEYVRIPGW